MADPRPKRIAFVELSDFSHTNRMLEDNLGPCLPGYRLDVIRVWDVFKRKPFMLAVGIAAALWHQGTACLKSRGALIEAIIKTPLFFRMASRIARRWLDAGDPPAAVLETQGLLDASLPGVPLVIYTDDVYRNPVHDAFPTSKPLDDSLALETELYHRADALAVAATHVADALRLNYGLGAEKVSVIYMGTNAPASPVATDLSPERYRRQQILFVGIGWERKGGAAMVAAFERLAPRFPDARLIICGSTPEISHPAITVEGLVPLERVAELMAESSIFCLPSYSEPFGIATIEAGLHGLACVGGDSAGFLDTIDDGVTGLRVPPGDVDAIEAALGSLLADPGKTEAMGRAGRERALALFRWPIVCEKLAGIIIRSIEARK